METDTFSKIILPALIGFAGVGLTSWLTYRLTRPKTIAEANKLKWDNVITFSEGLQNLYERALAVNEKTNQKMEEMEKRYEEKFVKFQEDAVQKDKDHALALQKKDDKIVELEERIDILERELKKYQNTDSQVEIAKEVLHTAVEENLQGLKKSE